MLQSTIRLLITSANKISSEPAVFLYTFAVGIYSSIIPNFIHQKVCSPEIEPDLQYVCNSTALLSEATDITTVRSTLREVLPVTVLLLAGCWRDSTGHNKPIMYLALFGDIVGITVELLGAVYWSVSPWVTSVFDGVLYGVAGGNKLFYVGALLIVTDQSSLEDRTARMGFFAAALVAGNCLSSAISGYALELFGYKWFFVVVIVLHLSSLLLVISIKEDKTNKVDMSKNWETLKKLKAVFKPRPNNGVVGLMWFCSCLINTCSAAEGNLYLYFLRQGFHFNVTTAGVYSSYRHMTSLVSSLVTPPLFTKILKWSDFKIGIVSALVTCISAVAMSLAVSTLQIFLFAWLEFLIIFLFTVPKSIITKSVKNDEVGIFLSLCYIGECLFPAGIFYIYDAIFSATSQTWPGAIYLASASVHFTLLLSFSIAHCIYVPLEEANAATTAQVPG